jgi:hypothetical protein
MTIKTDTPVNFNKAENDVFEWNASWGDYLYHKPSGRSIYQMMWKKTGEDVEPEIKAAAIEFKNELESLKSRQNVHADLISDEDYNSMAWLELKMDDPNSDY